MDIRRYFQFNKQKEVKKTCGRMPGCRRNIDFRQSLLLISTEYPFNPQVFRVEKSGLELQSRSTCRN